MAGTIYVVIPHVDNANVGKLIHASGDAAVGFQIQFERNYNLGATTRRHQIVPLAQVLDHYVLDVKGDGTLRHDYLEQVALSIPAPGRSSVSASTATWLRQVVAALVQAGAMGQESLQIVDRTPKN
ncbi:hypothetical protein K432DRAFT_420310 [Lepidopterella palustris CBS 459.81]|uniref:Uncharacterized protein n=1 Tax=Lepidopterella palustris CBS 459.81 TaxID=1314670 RepID=A0A8E2DZL6_9PEZI|nr:hypothetical protein K432DRAFT_420310 [Lepidopterella palustris CBS 459.81]